MSEVLPSELPVTDDAFLGDGLRVLQPKHGYRAGIDAVLLAATVAGDGALRVADLGAGAGVVGLCVARRLAAARVTLVEREAELGDLARQNAIRNGLSDRVAVAMGDVTGKAELLRLSGVDDVSFDAVLANPPFHATGHGTAAGNALKAASHAMDGEQLDSWVRCAARLTRPGGTFTMIHKADATGDILASFGQRFGGVKVKPLYARAGEPAIRVLLQGIKSSRAPLVLQAPLVLHGDGQGFMPGVNAILRDGAPLAM